MCIKLEIELRMDLSGEQKKIEFKEKYTRAFPAWKFYFDLDNLQPDSVSSIKTAQSLTYRLHEEIYGVILSKGQRPHAISKLPGWSDCIRVGVQLQSTRK